LGSKNVATLASSSGSSEPSSQSEVLSLKDTSSPAWIASQKGFVVGKMFSHNGAFRAPVDDHDLVVCSITSLAGDGIHLKEVSPFTQKPRQYVVEYANTDALSKYTGKPPVALPNEISDFFHLLLNLLFAKPIRLSYLEKWLPLVLSTQRFAPV
jgi:hypothetical protein